MSAEKRGTMESLYKTLSQISNSSITQKIANSDIWTAGSGSGALVSPPAGTEAAKPSRSLAVQDNADNGEGLPGTPRQQTGDAGGVPRTEPNGSSPAGNADGVTSDEDREKQGSASRRVSFKKTTQSKEQLIPRPTKCEEYRSFFHLPPEENLIEDFNCALQKKILLQGHMYLFDRYICFYSNIFGYEKKKVLPLRDVTVVRKAKTAAVFPNAIEIVAWGKRHFFASFLSRDEAYRLIILNWSQHSGYAKLFLGDRLNMEANGLPSTRSDTSARRDSDDEAEETLTFAESAVEALTEAVEEPPSSPLPPLPSVDGPLPLPDEGVLVEAPNDQEMTKGDEIDDRHVARRVAKPVSRAMPERVWEMEDVEPPEVPDTFKTIMDTELSVSSQELFHFFFSDEASDFLYNFHTTRGDQEFRCSPWQADSKYGHVRELSFRHPINFYFGPKSTFCKQTQSYRICRRDHVVLHTSQTMQDIPYGDYFSVEVRWDIEDLKGRGPGCCNLRISLDVPFTKKTVWKGKIEQGTLDESRETYQAWVQEAQAAILEARGGSRDSTPSSRDLTPHRQSATSIVSTSVTNDEVLQHLEGRIPVEYEHEIRRMLQMDGAARAPSVGHSPRVSTHGVSSPRQLARSASTSVHLAQPGTGEASLDEGAARAGVPGSSLVQGLKALCGRLVESEKAASRLKTGLVALVLAILLLLQAYLFLWSRSPAPPVGLTSSMEGPSFAPSCLMEGTCHVTDVEGEDHWLRGYWEQRFRFMREEMNLVEQRLQSLNREFSAAKGQFQADMAKAQGHRGQEHGGADESVS